MSSDHLAQHLHEKATRGEALSADEQARLDRWYLENDQEEAAALASAVPPRTVSTLKAQVDAAVSHLLTVTLRIETQLAENETVRNEVAELKRQLTQPSAKQPA